MGGKVGGGSVGTGEEKKGKPGLRRLADVGGPVQKERAYAGFVAWIDGNTRSVDLIVTLITPLRKSGTGWGNSQPVG